MNLDNLWGLRGNGNLIVRRCRFLDGPITMDELLDYQLGSKPFPRRTIGDGNGRPTQAERKLLADYRRQLVETTGNAGTDTETHWSKILLDNR